MRTFFRIAAAVFLLFAVRHEARAEAYLINDAMSQAILTNPSIGEAAANRRATEAELRQAQGFYLPQVRLQALVGPEKFTEAVNRPPIGSGKWFNGREGSIVIRQILFDGFTSIHEIWRQSARVDSAAFRVRERTELIALQAAEAYIDVVRFQRLVALANQNVANHEEILSNVRSRFSGGRVGEGDLEQALERVEAARVALEDFRQGLDDARSRYRSVVGVEAINLRFPGPLPGLPGSKDDALAIALRHNPALLAAGFDREAAKQAFHATAGAFVPNVALEGSASRGFDINGIEGRRDDVSGKVVVTWDIFRGGQDLWQRAETAERYTQASMAEASVQRNALESIDKAWAARTITVGRAVALTRQLLADRKTIAIYRKEYEIGQRSLIDLLNAENQYFNAAVQLTSTRGVIVFADYQLLAAMGALLEYLKAPAPIDAAPLDTIPLVVLPLKAPPILFGLPPVGSEPLNVGAWAWGNPFDISEPVAFDQRWPAEWLAKNAEAGAAAGAGVKVATATNGQSAVKTKNTSAETRENGPKVAVN